MASFAVVSNLGFAAAMLAVALMVLAAAPGRSCNRYFSSFLAARGLVTGIYQVVAMLGETRIASALDELAFWLDLAAAGALVAFVIVYVWPTQRSWARGIRWVTLVGATLLTTMVPESPGRSLVALALPLAEAWAAVLFVWLLRTERHAARTDTDWLFAMAFVPLSIIEGLLPASAAIGNGFTPALWFTGSPFTGLDFVGHALVGVVGLAAGLALLHGTTVVDAMRGRAAGVVGIVGFTLAAVLLPHVTPHALDTAEAGGFLAGVIRLIVPALAAYGLVRYRLFVPPTAFRTGINRGVMATVFVAVYFVVSEGTAAAVGDWTGSAFAGIFAALLLILAIVPLERAVRRVTEGIVPSEPSMVQPLRSRQRAYRQQVELAWLDGQLDVKERLMLARMRDHLQLSAAEGDEVEAAVLRHVARAQYTG